MHRPSQRPITETSGPGRHGALGSATIQELLGHNDVATTMIYTHVLRVGGAGMKSPLDCLSAGTDAP